MFIFIFIKKWKMNFERWVAEVVFNFQQKWKLKWTKIFQILRKMYWHSGTRIEVLLAAPLCEGQKSYKECL